MNKTTLLLFCALLLIALAGCSTPPPPPKIDVAAEAAKLRETEAQWVKDAATKDVDKFVSHYTDDAVFMNSGMAALKGKDAIRNGLKPLLDDPNFKLEFSADRVEISESGELGYTQGSYRLTVSNPKTKKPVNDAGSYVTVFKKQPDGSWRAVEDIAASSGGH